MRNLMNLTWLNDHLSIIAQILGSIGAILAVVFLIFPQLRPVLLNALRVLFAPLTAPWGIRKLGRDVDDVRKQLSKDSGWISRGLADLELGQRLLEDHRKHNFLIQPRPAFEMDSDANVLMASGMAARLFAVEYDSALRGLSYLMFLASNDVEEFKISFLSTAKAASEFRFEVAMHDSRRKPIGVFEWRCRPIGPRINGHLIYTANLYPISETARATAARLGWSYGS